MVVKGEREENDEEVKEEIQRLPPCPWSPLSFFLPSLLPSSIATPSFTLCLTPSLSLCLPPNNVHEHSVFHHSNVSDTQNWCQISNGFTIGAHDWKQCEI